MDTYWLLGRADPQEESKPTVSKPDDDMPAFLQYFGDEQPARPPRKLTTTPTSITRF